MSSARQSPSEVRSVKDAVRERDGYRCVGCGITNEQYKEVFGRVLDVRLRRSGSAYTEDGCETACRRCNVRLSQRKGGRHAKRSYFIPPSQPVGGRPRVSRRKKVVAAVPAAPVRDMTTTVTCTHCRKLFPADPTGLAVLAGKKRADGTRPLEYRFTCPHCGKRTAAPEWPTTIE